MCKSKIVSSCTSISFMFGTIVGVLAGHASETDSFFSLKHLLLIGTATVVFYLTQTMPRFIKKGSQ